MQAIVVREQKYLGQGHQTLPSREQWTIELLTK